jgi:hypothetical protein
MATLAEQMRALREPEHRGIRRLTVDVSEDDLRTLAERGYEGAASTDQDQQEQAVGLFITDMARLPRWAKVTALRRLQRRFSNGVTTVATPFQPSGK